MSDAKIAEVRKLYQDFIEAWNNRDAEGMANCFTDDGEMIGFDGSLASGKSTIFSHLEPIFKEHPTPPFISKIKQVRQMETDIFIVRAIAGMVPPGEKELDSSLNTHQTLVASLKEDKWLIELFQNTPAQYHGRPELVEEMTNELKNV